MVNCIPVNTQHKNRCGNQYKNNYMEHYQPITANVTDKLIKLQNDLHSG